MLITQLNFICFLFLMTDVLLFTVNYKRKKGRNFSTDAFENFKLPVCKQLSFVKAIVQFYRD